MRVVIAATNGLAPSEIAYVGDRLDNDIEPALRAGMVPVFIRRGPWAHVQSASRRFPVPPHIIDELISLPELLRGL
ncbi:HAD family hydrolase [Paraburkholderia sediminicola]